MGEKTDPKLAYLHSQQTAVKYERTGKHFRVGRGHTGETKAILVLGAWVESLVTFGLAAGDTYRRNSDEEGLGEAAGGVPGREDDGSQHGGWGRAFCKNGIPGNTPSELSSRAGQFGSVRTLSFSGVLALSSLM